MKFIFELNDVGLITYILKLFFTGCFSYFTVLKIINNQIKSKRISCLTYTIILFVSIICGIIKYEINLLSCLITFTISLSILMAKVLRKHLGYSILITIISLSINYIIFFAATTVTLIPTLLFNIQNMYINLGIIVIMYIIILMLFLKIKRLKNGIIFLQKNIDNEYFDVLLLNLSVYILFGDIIISDYKRDFSIKVAFALIIFSIIMFITIQKSLQLYYKQKMLIKELEETKEEVCKKTKEIEELEAENIKISKKNHTLSHKQKSLEYKIEQMLSNTEISKEEVAEVQERLKAIQKEFYKEKATTELDKTEIPEIDDMLKYMQSECIKNKIDFELQIKGNIHHMTNNLITKEDLETLLADHIKNAIIAINHTDNVNRSILVRLGKIDETYSMYIYDTGVEFEKETLENLGKKPSTTHSDEGGTGMGFMNTFDTLRKCKASLIIEEYNKPSRDNYTKAMIVKFDEKNEFKINSYRESIMNKS